MTLPIRLSTRQVDGIVKAIIPYNQNCNVSLYLYGSRTDIHKKGGDIDLLLVTESTSDKAHFTANKHRILSTIKKNIGDQKIDLLISSTNELSNDPFIKSIIASAVHLPLV